MSETFGSVPQPPSDASKKVPAGVCGIILGALGVHKFILGYTAEGIIMLVVTIIGFFLCWIGPLVMGTFGLIEGIIYLTKSDKVFSSTYVQNKRAWF